MGRRVVGSFDGSAIFDDLIAIVRTLCVNGDGMRNVVPFDACEDNAKTYLSTVQALHTFGASRQKQGSHARIGQQADDAAGVDDLTLRALRRLASRCDTRAGLDHPLEYSPQTGPYIMLRRC